LATNQRPDQFRSVGLASSNVVEFKIGLLTEQIVVRPACAFGPKNLFDADSQPANRRLADED
jgi:hypothetical protein